MDEFTNQEAGRVEAPAPPPKPFYDGPERRMAAGVSPTGVERRGTYSGEPYLGLERRVKIGMSPTKVERRVHSYVPGQMPRDVYVAPILPAEPLSLHTITIRKSDGEMKLPWSHIIDKDKFIVGCTCGTGGVFETLVEAQSFANGHARARMGAKIVDDSEKVSDSHLDHPERRLLAKRRVQTVDDPNRKERRVGPADRRVAAEWPWQKRK